MLFGGISRYRGVWIPPWSNGTFCLYRLTPPRCLQGRIRSVRMYTTQHQPSPPPPTNSVPQKDKGGVEVAQAYALAILKHVGELGKQWGQKSAKTASATVNYWWERYEEFVGLNEVRDAQAKVNEAEAAFMVARGIVREAHASLEALQVRLKEVRDRLDRVSREEAHYLELATLEHKLLQEERRLRMAYENAGISEREKFALFSAGVRGSHEKERTRAERTKNWSIIGSVLGALIGVMGSTYVNRVRLQELKSLLLEAQKGPENLQEALRVQAGNHRSQQDELRLLIDNLRVILKDAITPGDSAENQEWLSSPSYVSHTEALKELNVHSQKTQSFLEALPSQLNHLKQGVDRVESELSAVRGMVETGRRLEKRLEARAAQQLQREERPEKSVQQDSDVVVKGLEETQRRLEVHITRNTILNTLFSCTAAALTVPAIYIMLRGSG